MYLIKFAMLWQFVCWKSDKINGDGYVKLNP